MRLVKAEKEINKEVISILEEAGLRNGDLLDDDEFKSLGKEVPFWNLLAERKEAAALPLNVIWQVVGIDPIGKADDKVSIRRAYVGIDIYATNKVRKQDLIALIDKIDEKFIENNWDFEKASFDSVNNEGGKTLYRYEAIKKI